MIRLRAAWIVCAALLAMPTEGRAEAACPVVLRSCPPGTAVAIDRVAGVSFVDLERGTCVEPWSAPLPVAVLQAASEGSAPIIGEGIVWIVAPSVLLLAIIVGGAVYAVRARELDAEFKKVALREPRCSPAKEVASLCSVLLTLLVEEETGARGLETERDALMKACATYKSKALSP